MNTQRDLLQTALTALKDAERNVEEAKKATSRLFALYTLQDYEPSAPDTAEGYTADDEAAEIVGVVQEAAACINPAHGLTIRMVWEYQDSWGFGGDSEMIAFKPFHAGGYAMYTIPVLGGLATAMETFEGLWNAFDDHLPAFGHTQHLPPVDDGLNAAWKRGKD